VYKPTLDQLARDAGTTVEEAGRERMQQLIDEWYARENEKLYPPMTQLQGVLMFIVLPIVFVAVPVLLAWFVTSR
jgi:hypothetical protein